MRKIEDTSEIFGKPEDSLDALCENNVLNISSLVSTENYIKALKKLYGIRVMRGEDVPAKPSDLWFGEYHGTSNPVKLKIKDLCYVVKGNYSEDTTFDMAKILYRKLDRVEIKQSVPNSSSNRILMFFDNNLRIRYEDSKECVLSTEHRVCEVDTNGRKIYDLISSLEEVYKKISPKTITQLRIDAEIEPVFAKSDSSQRCYLKLKGTFAPNNSGFSEKPLETRIIFE